MVPIAVGQRLRPSGRRECRDELTRARPQVRFTWDAPADNGRGPMQTRYNVDERRLVRVDRGGGLVVGNASPGHSIQVQGQDFDSGLPGRRLSVRQRPTTARRRPAGSLPDP